MSEEFEGGFEEKKVFYFGKEIFWSAEKLHVTFSPNILSCPILIDLCFVRTARVKYHVQGMGG